MTYDKEHLKAIERKLKKQGKSPEEVEAFIKNLINPNKMDEEKKEEEVLEPEVPVEAEAAPEEPEEEEVEPEEAPEPVLDGEEDGN